MVFTKRLREGIRRGRIRCSVRVWMNPRVKAGGRYRMDDGHVVVDSITPIDLGDITHDLARESGFDSVHDLLEIARHGRGDHVYLIRFHYLPAGAWDHSALESKMAMQTFRAILEPVSPGGCFVVVPPEIAAAAGLKFKDRVRGTINGATYRSSLMKYGGVFHMGVHKATLASAGVRFGDEVSVAIDRDTAPLPTDRIPPDLARAFAARKGAAAAFAALAPSRRREYVGSVLEAKKPETRTRRIAKVLAALRS